MMIFGFQETGPGGCLSLSDSLETSQVDRIGFREEKKSIIFFVPAPRGVHFFCKSGKFSVWLVIFMFH